MTSQQQSAPNSTLENLGPSMTREWACDRRIVIFSIRSNERRAIDAYCEMIKQTMAEWPREQPYLALYDHSDPRLSLSPYTRQKVRELSPLFPELKGYIAMVLSGFFVPLAQIMIQARSRAGRGQAIFRNRHDALDWLTKKLSEQP